MSNQSEVDYDKQFQDDLAKATALSLEQQALDDYRRAKKYGTAAHYYSERAQTQSPTFQPTHSVPQRQQSTESAKAFYAQLRTRYQQSRGNSNDIGTSAAPPIPPSRRHSEANNNVSLNVAAVTAASRERSKTPPATLLESDLISFSSPTSKEAQSNTLEKLIEDLQKLQTTTPQTALVPFGPVAAAPIAPMHAAAGYRHAGTPTHNAAFLQHYAASAGGVAPGAVAVGGAGAGNSMQMVPFTPTPAQQKVPLTSEELQKLYNMPLQQQQQQQQQYYQQQQQQQQQYTAAIMPAGVAYPPARAGYVPSVGGFAAPTHAANYTQSAPATAAAAAAFTPPQFPPTVSHYGFQYGALPGSSTPYYGAPHITAAAAGNAAAAAASMPLSKSQSAAAAILSNGSNGGNYTQSAAGSGAAGLRRQTPPARKPPRTGSDLIDLSQEDDSRVSVLEAFDPLLNADEEVWKK